MEANIQLISIILNFILAFVSTVFGKKWSTGKSKSKQVADLIIEGLVAVEDGQLSPEEIKSIFAHATELLGLSTEEVRAKVRMKRMAKMKK